MSLSRRFSYSRGGKFGGAMDTYIRKFVFFARISPSGIGPRLSEPQLQRPLRGSRGTWTRVVQSKPLRLGEPRSFGSGCAGLRTARPTSVEIWPLFPVRLQANFYRNGRYPLTDTRRTAGPLFRMG